MRAKRRKKTILFRKPRRTPCPACLDRNALNLVGRPLYNGGFRLTSGCEICLGQGEVTQAECSIDRPGELWVLR
jgi:hypothetical protein